MNTDHDAYPICDHVVVEIPKREGYVPMVENRGNGWWIYYAPKPGETITPKETDNG